MKKKELTSTEIFNDLNHKLKTSIKELFPRYYLDTICFENLGTFTDWTRINKNASSNYSVHMNAHYMTFFS